MQLHMKVDIPGLYASHVLTLVKALDKLNDVLMYHRGDASKVAYDNSAKIAKLIDKRMFILKTCIQKDITRALGVPIKTIKKDRLPDR